MDQSNLLQLKGFIGQEPKFRQAGEGGYTSFSLGCKIKVGFGQNATERKFFFKIEKSDKNRYLFQRIKKGDLVVVTGSLDMSTWVDQQSGKNRYEAYMRASEVELLQVSAPSNQSGHGGNDQGWHEDQPNGGQNGPPQGGYGNQGGQGGYGGNRANQGGQGGYGGNQGGGYGGQQGGQGGYGGNRGGQGGYGGQQGGQGGPPAGQGGFRGPQGGPNIPPGGFTDDDIPFAWASFAPLAAGLMAAAAAASSFVT